MNATGGTITTVGSDNVHTFTSSGSFVVTGSGNVRVLVIGGGGGGASAGGGAGGYQYNASYAVTTGSYTVTIGNGGTGGSGYAGSVIPTAGDNSVFDTITANGGGYGGYNFGDATLHGGGNGGSGGGEPYSGVSHQGVGTGSQGSNGGLCFIGTQYPAGGGGGAGAVGGNAPDGQHGGVGGDGIQNDINGTNLYYAGGGGGGIYGLYTGGAGGQGGGGKGGDYNQNGTNGTDGLGGGGGGAGGSLGPFTGGNGGKGVVIIRYNANNPPNTPTNTTPANAATNISRNVTLVGSAYSDPESDAQVASQWQVATDSGFTSVVWDSGTAGAVTTLAVTTGNGTFAGALAGKTRLAQNTTYYWRCKYSDGVFGGYSTGTSFTTWVSPATPSITSPTANQTNIDRNPTITSSAFSSPDGFTHTSSDWQVATDAGFSSVVWSDTADSTNKTSVTVNTTNGTFAGVLVGLTQLAESTDYYVRVRYTDSDGGVTAYASGIKFTTRAATINYNSEMVKEYPKGITDCQKPGMTAVAEATPTASRPDGSLRIDLATNRFYWRSNSAWHYTTGSLMAVTTKTGTYTATDTDDLIICNSATAFTINLPVAAATGKLYYIKNINTGVITVDGKTTDTIDGQLTQTVNQWECIVIADYIANAWVIV